LNLQIINDVTYAINPARQLLRAASLIGRFDDAFTRPTNSRRRANLTP
jgi:hypothetical protein